MILPDVLFVKKANLNLVIHHKWLVLSYMQILWGKIFLLKLYRKRRNLYEGKMAEVDNQASPVEVVNTRAGFFDEKQDAEYFGFGFIAGGLLVGILGSVMGNILSELVLDEMRINKFGYREDGKDTKRSFWKLGESNE